jgi:hypothetical protein
MEVSIEIQLQVASIKVESNITVRRGCTQARDPDSNMIGVNQAASDRKCKFQNLNSYPSYHPCGAVAARTVAEGKLTFYPSYMAGHDVPRDYRKGFLLLPEG